MNINEWRSLGQTWNPFTDRFRAINRKYYRYSCSNTLPLDVCNRIQQHTINNHPTFTKIHNIFFQNQHQFFLTILIFGRFIFGQKGPVRKLIASENKCVYSTQKWTIIINIWWKINKNMPVFGHILVIY